LSEVPPQHRSPVPQGARFSLASILLFTSVVAIFLGAIRVGFVGQPTRAGSMALGAACGMLVGGLVGFVIGQGQSPGFLGRAASRVVGGIAGSGAGVLVALPEGLWVIIPGAMLLVLFAAVVRWLSQARLQ